MLVKFREQNLSTVAMLTARTIAVVVIFAGLTSAACIWIVPNLPFLKENSFSTTIILFAGSTCGALMAGYATNRLHYPPDSTVVRDILVASSGIAAFLLIFYLSPLVVLNVKGG
jgi:hypothetical protein